MTAIYTDKLDDTVDKSNNTFHRTIKMEPTDIKSSTYIDFHVENNYEDPKQNVGDNVRISKYKTIFAKSYIPN